MPNKAKTGRVIYSERAFHQDASEAMRGDVVRGLIELITNSDDAYGENKGKIRIEIERRHGPWKIIVRDRAKGMRSSFMEEALIKLGGRTSGFESGMPVRGNRGRGAKDLAAFGEVVFESICDDRYSKLVLEPTGDYRLDAERRASQSDRERLSIPRNNGTVVALIVDGNIRYPQHDKLKENLSRHYQLRDILADSRREVILVDVRKGTQDVLRYQYPPFPVVYEGELAIHGYPEAKAIVTIQRATERYDQPPSDPYRPGGLLLKGRRAIYENTLFRFESNPHAGWFTGEVRCEYIDELASDYDRRWQAGMKADEINPLQIITRRRDGLEHNHPFYTKLSAEVEKHLGELVAAEEENARKDAAGESLRMRKTLDELGRDIGKLINEDLREIDEEGLGGPGKDPEETPALAVIPENPVLYSGEEKTVTVRARQDSDVDFVDIRLDPEGVVEVLDGAKIELRPHRTRSDLLTGQIHLRPLLEQGESFLTVSCREHGAVALVEVRSEPVIEEVEIEAPESLQFEREIYRLAWTKRKSLCLMTPIDLVAAEGKHVRVTSNSDGVVVLGGDCEMKLDDEVEFYMSHVMVEARTIGARAMLRAELGSVTATSNVVVSREGDSPSIKIRILDEEAGHRRALVETEGDKVFIKIMGRHPAFRRYRGPAPKFPGDDLSVCQTLVAEIVAHEAARIVMERRYQSGSASGSLDAASLYVEHSRYLKKYLTQCHRRLISDNVVARGF